MGTRAVTGIFARFRGDALGARAMRSAAWAIGGFGGSQALRLASNLILARLLFPEAFGLMALIQVVLTGLSMFSDLGTAPAIMQSRRGDNPDFLNTAWTIQALRGVALWLGATALAWPVALFYGEPQLIRMLPVAALTLLLTGLNPTRLYTANRHLRLGRVTVIDLSTQAVSIVAAVAMAMIWHSVWALVLSGIVSAAMQLWAYNRFLHGAPNRFRWEREAAAELIRFGRWIFLSTVAGFLHLQGDRLVLGKFLTLGMLGLYNIGFFLASVPLMLGYNLASKMLIPLYRESPPGASRDNFARLQRMRFALSALIVAGLAVLALAGPWLVGVLYDDRYRAAGSVVTLVALVQIPAAICLTYDQAALAAGDSARFFRLSLFRAVATLSLLLLGAWVAGLGGALAGQALAGLLSYPVFIWLARTHSAWDPRHDAVFWTIGAAVAGGVLVQHGEKIRALFTIG